MASSVLTVRKMLAISIVAVLTAGGSQANPTGIGGDANNEGDVALAGCTCHADEPDNSVTLILTDVPYRYEPGESYEMVIQIIEALLQIPHHIPVDSRCELVVAPSWLSGI